MLIIDREELGKAVAAAIMASMPEPTPEAAKEACERAEAWVNAYQEYRRDNTGSINPRMVG